MITFEQIQKANEHLTSIDIKGSGKGYVLVAERVRAFRMIFPEGFIKTEILRMENGVCLMKAKAGFYDNGQEVVLSTGLAYEKETSGFINRNSLVENAETSAVGRALGFLALGIEGDAICSAEELVNAMINQKNNAAQPIPAISAAPVRKEEKVIDLSEIRSNLEVAIKEKTKDMSKGEKISFLNGTVMKALNGERNWRLCQDPALLLNLLHMIQPEAA